MHGGKQIWDQKNTTAHLRFSHQATPAIGGLETNFAQGLSLLDVDQATVSWVQILDEYFAK